MWIAISALVTGILGYFIHAWTHRIQKTDIAYEKGIEALIAGTQKQEAAWVCLRSACIFHNDGNDEMAQIYIQQILSIFQEDNPNELSRIMATAFLYCDEDLIKLYFDEAEPMEVEFRKSWLVLNLSIASLNWTALDEESQKLGRLIPNYSKVIKKLIIKAREGNDYLTIVSGLFPFRRLFKRLFKPQHHSPLPPPSNEPAKSEEDGKNS